MDGFAMNRIDRIVVLGALLEANISLSPARESPDHPPQQR